MTITTDLVVKKYIELRDEAERIDHEAQQRINAIKDNMQKLEAWLNAKLDQDGEQSKRTQFGTVFFSTVDFATVSDWDAALTYIRDHQAWDMLEHRISKKGVRAVIDESKVVPPGVNYGTKRVVNVHRPTKK